MVNQLVVDISAVFVEDGKGGRGDDIAYAKGFANGFYKGGLSCSHLAIEGKNGIFAHLLHKLLGSLGEVFG